MASRVIKSETSNKVLHLNCRPDKNGNANLNIVLLSTFLLKLIGFVELHHSLSRLYVTFDAPLKLLAPGNLFVFIFS